MDPVDQCNADTACDSSMPCIEDKDLASCPLLGPDSPPYTGYPVPPRSAKERCESSERNDCSPTGDNCIVITGDGDEKAYCPTLRGGPFPAELEYYFFGDAREAGVHADVLDPSKPILEVGADKCTQQPFEDYRLPPLYDEPASSDVYDGLVLDSPLATGALCSQVESKEFFVAPALVGLCQVKDGEFDGGLVCQGDDDPPGKQCTKEFEVSDYPSLCDSVKDQTVVLNVGLVGVCSSNNTFSRLGIDAFYTGSVADSEFFEEQNRVCVQKEVDLQGGTTFPVLEGFKTAPTTPVQTTAKAYCVEVTPARRLLGWGMTLGRKMLGLDQE